MAFIRGQTYFRRTSRELKRIEGTTRSPIFSKFEETLNGLSIIRGFKVEHRFLRQMKKRLDTHCRVFFYNVKHAYSTYMYAYFEDTNKTLAIMQKFTARWLAIRLDFVVVVLIAATS